MRMGPSHRGTFPHTGVWDGTTPTMFVWSRHYLLGHMGSPVGKAVEQLKVPADLHDLTNELSQQVHPNPNQLRAAVTRLMEQRNWLWLLQHPDLGPDHIHPSRSMPRLLPLWCP